MWTVGGGFVAFLLAATTAVVVVVVGAADAAASPTTAPAASPAAALDVGIQDSSINNCDRHETATQKPDYAAAAATLDDRYWAGLHVSTVRYSPPWDIAYHHDRNGRDNAALQVEQLCFNYWLSVVAAHHVTPEVAFKPDYNYLDRAGSRIAVPGIATYRAAMDAFFATYGGQVRIVAPWGEPNFRGDGVAGFAHKPQVFAMPNGRATFDDPHCGPHPTAADCGPVLAAQMWVAVQHRCGTGCTVIAGDFSSSGGLETSNGSASYLDTYARHLDGRRPATWGVHPYLDLSTVEYDWITHKPLPALRDTITARFATALRQLGYRNHTDIWLDEVSAFQIDMYCRPVATAPRGSVACKNAAGRVTGMHYRYGPALQARAVSYLLDTLSWAGGRSTPGQPIVTRVYYLRYRDPVGYPNVALVLTSPNGQEQRQPAYDVIAHRRR